MRFERILVALDGTQQAEAALPYAEALAGLCDGDLVLIDVVPLVPVNPFDKTGTMAAYRGGEQTELILAAEYLAEVEARLRGRGRRVISAIKQGDAAVNIIEFATEVQADLIVLASRGGTDVPRWTLSGAVERVARRAKCPVLLVNPPIPPSGDLPEPGT